MTASHERMVTWLTDTTMGKIALWCLERLAFFLGAAITLWCVYSAEIRLAPVVTNWTMDYATKAGNKMIVGGKLTKQRSCELISTSIMAVPKAPLVPRVLIYQITPQEIMGGNVPAGETTWGPWELAIPVALVQRKDEVSYLEIIGTHRCHGLWNQETSYGTVPMSRLPIS